MISRVGNIKVIAVTGASGFCGSVVSRALHEQGYHVVTLGRRPGPVGEHRHWDASTTAVPDLSGAHAVVHLAAAVGDRYSPDAEREFARINVDAAHRLLEAAGQRRVVWVSSSSVYDPRIDRSFVSENHPTDAGHMNAYGRTKAAGDRAALEAGAVVIRPRAIYGTNDTVLLPRLVGAVRGSILRLPGRDVSMSMTSVDNLASACVAALQWPAGAYNVADGEHYSRDSALQSVLSAALHRAVRVRHVPLIVAELLAKVSLVRARVGADVRLSPYSIDQLSHTFVLDIRKAMSTGWEPESTLSQYISTFPIYFHLGAL
jgi:nucleoside-diphosphate-sugar epimerase